VCATAFNSSHGNGFGINGVDAGHTFCCDFAAILELPGWASIVSTDCLIFTIMQLGFRSGKGPSVLAVAPGLAGVDLRSGGVREENNLFTRGAAIESGTSGGDSF
jgi:hypothetical protein